MRRVVSLLWALAVHACTPLKDSVVARDASVFDVSSDLPREASDGAAPEDIGDGEAADAALAPPRCDANVCSPDLPVRIAAGSGHACALRSSGRVVCWGSNDRAQLGKVTASTRPPPVEVLAVTDARSISAGFGLVCAVRRSGEAWCWGRNGDGAIGTGSYSDGHAPTPVVDIGPVRSVAAGGGLRSDRAGRTHACALTVGGEVLCWGANSDAQTGGSPETMTARPGPPVLRGVLVASGDASPLVAGGFHNCVLEVNGRARCWGSNNEGQITPGRRVAPGEVVEVAFERAIAQMDAGANHTCAALDDGTVRCWGANTYAQCGATAASVTPAAVTVPITDVAQVAAGVWHTCARSRRGEVSCWGRNNLGQLGQPTLSPSTSRTPLAVALPAPAIDLSAGNAFACALLVGGEVWCWGEAHVGQVGRPAAAWLPPGPVPLAPGA